MSGGTPGGYNMNPGGGQGALGANAGFNPQAFQSAFGQQMNQANAQQFQNRLQDPMSGLNQYGALQRTTNGDPGGYAGATASNSGGLQMNQLASLMGGGVGNSGQMPTGYQSALQKSYPMGGTDGTNPGEANPGTGAGGPSYEGGYPVMPQQSTASLPRLPWAPMGGAQQSPTPPANFQQRYQQQLAGPGGMRAASSYATGSGWNQGGQQMFADKYGFGTPEYNAAINASSPGGAQYTPEGFAGRHLNRTFGPQNRT